MLHLPEEIGWFKLLWVKSLHKSIENIERHIASQRQKLDYHHKKMEQVNYCVIKYTRVLSMLSNRFPDWGGGRVFFRVEGTGSEFLYMAPFCKSRYVLKVVIVR